MSADRSPSLADIFLAPGRWWQRRTAQARQRRQEVLASSTCPECDGPKPVGYKECSDCWADNSARP